MTWYHAGAVGEITTVWSNHSRRTAAKAEKEARALTRKHGGRAVVEYWDGHHGPAPGDCELVEDAYFVDDEP